MTFEQAVDSCHVRSAIYRQSEPSKLYWKNSLKRLAEQVPVKDQSVDDWEEYDPSEHEPPSHLMA